MEKIYKAKGSYSDKYYFGDLLKDYEDGRTFISRMWGKHRILTEVIAETVEEVNLEDLDNSNYCI
jgi:hypothetical protein